MDPIYRTAATAAVAFLAVVVLTPLVKRFATRIGAVSVPKEDRWHTRSVPMLGGAAIFGGVITGMAFGGSMTPSVLPVIVAGTCMFVVGTIDDFLSLKPGTKLTAQIATACAVVMLGVVPHWSGSAAIDSLLAIIWIVAVCNAVNLLDNMDGLCAGIAAIASFVCALDLLAPQNGLSSCAAALTGASLGFLVYNFRPASIFMGDGGSLFLGISLATLALQGGSHAGSRVASAVAVPAFILLIPIFDTTFVTLSRLLSTRSAAQGGRDHTSHRLVAMGFSESEAVLILWALGAAGGAAAVLGRYSALSEALLVGPLLLIALALLGIQLARVRVYNGDDYSLLLGKPYTPLLLDVTYKRRIFEVLLDLVLVAFSYYAAYIIRFDRDSYIYYGLFTQSLPVIIACQLTSFFVCGVYRGSWRYVGLWDVTTYAKGIGLGVLSSIMVLVYLYRFEGYSRGVFLVDGMLLVMLMLGSRLSFRVIGEAAGRHRRSERRVLIYGAGDGGALLLRELRNNPDYGFEPVGFIDDDAGKHRKRMLRLPVVGGIKAVPTAIAEHRPYAIVISTRKLQANTLNELERLCYESGTRLLRLRFDLDEVGLPRPTHVE